MVTNPVILIDVGIHWILYIENFISINHNFIHASTREVLQYDIINFVVYRAEHKSLLGITQWKGDVSLFVIICEVFFNRIWRNHAHEPIHITLCNCVSYSNELTINNYARTNITHHAAFIMSPL